MVTTRKEPTGAIGVFLDCEKCPNGCSGSLFGQNRFNASFYWLIRTKEERSKILEAINDEIRADSRITLLERAGYYEAFDVYGYGLMQKKRIVKVKSIGFVNEDDGTYFIEKQPGELYHKEERGNLNGLGLRTAIPVRKII